MGRVRAKGRTHGNAVGVRCANISVRHGNRAHFDDGTFTLEATSQNKLLSDCLAVPFTSLSSSPPPLAVWKRPAARAGKPAASAAEPTNSGRRGGAGGLRPEGAAALSPTPGALQGRGRGRRRGARWEMQSRPSERLNPGRGSLLLASEDLFFFPPVPQGLRDQEEGIIVL